MMIGETGLPVAKENKTKTTNPPVVFEVYGVEGLNMKRIDMYIDHDSSVGVCFCEWCSASRPIAIVASFSPVSR